jgi:hypothetical protein
MTNEIIQLQLSEKLQKEQIVTKYIFDLNNLDIVLELNSIYDKKLIVSPIEITDWQYTIQSLKDIMEDQNISKEHITMLCDTADDNAKKLGKGKKKKQKDKRVSTIYKYSNNFQGDLHEAIVLGGKPAFIKYNGKTIKVVKSIKEESRNIIPPFVEEYAYRPYEFKDLNEVLAILERARKLSIGSIYSGLKPIICSYNDQAAEKQILLTIVVIWSYFQDRFPTTHYDIILGGNGSGKSAEATTYNATGYRPVNLTNPNAANINRILGSIEPGQCTIISDETRGLEKNTDLLSVLAEGYNIGGQTSKVNDFTRKPEFFKAYCYKMILSEKMPNLRELRGIIDRSFVETSYKGRPQFDIKETLTPQGNPHRQRRFNILNDFRKLMLVYRLLHFKDLIFDINVGVYGREKELVKPTLQLFYKTSAQKEVEKTLQYYLDKRREKKDVSIEPILHLVVTSLCDELKINELPVKTIWERLKQEVPGHSDVERDRDGNIIELKRPNEYHTQDYGTVYITTISSILEHTFGGIPKHKRIGNTYLFNRERLKKVSSALNRDIETIHTSDGEDCEDCEDCEGTRGSTFEGVNEPYIYNNNNKNKTNKLHQGSSHSSHSSHLDPDLEQVERELAERSAAGAERSGQK